MPIEIEYWFELDMIMKGMEDRHTKDKILCFFFHFFKVLL